MLLLRRLTYLTLVATTAIAMEVMLAGAQSYWVVWAALALSLIIIGNSFVKRLGAVLLFGFGLAVVTLLANLSSLSTPVFIIFIAIVTVVCAVVGQRKREYFYSYLILVLFALVAGALPASIAGSVDRSLSILLGTGIAALYQFIFLPWFGSSEMHAAVVMLIKHLRILAQDIFACFLQPEHADNVYLFEHRIHTQKSRCLQVLEYARSVARDHEIKMLDSLEHVFESLLACSLLRFRVSDQTIFAVCCTELAEISESIDSNLAELVSVYEHKNPLMNTDGLQERINRLENNYQTVLQVTAKEPLVFLLFISSLKSLAEQIKEFSAND